MLYSGGRIEIIKADITKLDVDMIVNAANAALCGGGGVDGAIHAAAGPALLEECRTLGGAWTGDVKLTRGHQLRARFIAHAVGPVWSGGDGGEDVLLAGCYVRAMLLARERGLSTLAFPSISTGAYRFPIARASRIALSTVRDELKRHPSIKRATFCCFSGADLRVYKRSADALLVDDC